MSQVSHNPEEKTVDVAQLEQIRAADGDPEVLKSYAVGDVVDNEVGEYAATGRVEIEEATNKRLKRLIDRRILAVMVCVYLVQALDKGTLSFTSIMGLLTDTHLHGTEVCDISSAKAQPTLFRSITDPK